VGDHRDLDEHELAAHCVVRMHLYGNERIRIADIRGDLPATAHAEIAIKNLRIAGSVPTLLAVFEAMALLLSEAIENPDSWDSVPARGVRHGSGSASIQSRPRLRVVGEIEPISPPTDQA
jgi:hypothetical protein